MEEKQTIIACGAGASTKVVFHNESDDNHSVRIERIENVKDVRSYIERIDEMIERKRKFFLGRMSFDKWNGLTGMGNVISIGNQGFDSIRENNYFFYR